MGNDKGQGKSAGKVRLIAKVKEKMEQGSPSDQRRAEQKHAQDQIIVSKTAKGNGGAA